MDRLRQWLVLWAQRRTPPATRIRLQQRQIFIVPTVTGFAFGGALLLMLLVAINYQNSLAYALVFILASLALLTALHTWRNLAGLELQGKPGQPCYAGENALFPVVLEATDHARFGITLGWQRAAGVQTDISKGQGSTLLLELAAKQRGWLHAPGLRVETRYPLGIWVAWSLIDLDMQALVYPAPVEAALPPTAGGSDEEDTAGGREAARGADDYQGLEAWQKGDSLRRVDWKAWSRGQGLWVKQFAELQGSELILDYTALAGDPEQRLSVLCFHILRLEGLERPYGLQLPGLTLEPALGSAHRDACLRALALFGKEAA